MPAIELNSTLFLSLSLYSLSKHTQLADESVVLNVNSSMEQKGVNARVSGRRIKHAGTLREGLLNILVGK